MQNVEWGDLPFLLALSRANTMTAAAKKLAVNQTTVARRLDALEESLGVQLVERRRDGITLTEEGWEAVRIAEEMEGAAMELERSLLGSSAELAGLLRVTTADMISVQHPELFASFAKAYPNIELELVTGYGVLSLSRREADVAIRLTNKPAENLFGRKLVRVEYALYGEKALVSSMGRAPVSTYPWLTWTKSSAAGVTERWMKKHVPNANIVCRLDSSLTMFSSVEAGAGIAFLPCAYGDASDRLKRLRPPEAGFGYDLWVLTHRDLAKTARVRAFLRHVGQYFDGLQPRFSGTG